MEHGPTGSCWTNVILPLQRRGLKVTCIPIPTNVAKRRRCRFESRSRANKRPARPGRPRLRRRCDCRGAWGPSEVPGVHRRARANEGETVARSAYYRDEPDPKAPKLAPDAHGSIWMPEGEFRDAVAKSSADQTSIMQAVQRPIAVQCIQEPAPAPIWKVKPSWFLLAEEDRMINPKTQRFMADRMKATVRSERVDHSPMYTAADLVVELILEAASETMSIGASV